MRTTPSDPRDPGDLSRDAVATGRRATIADVARAAGVGKVTVSYVLNGHAERARISESTRRRVEREAERLAYRPHAAARSLRRRRADAIAVVFQYAELFHANSTFVPELMSGVCAACVELGLDVVLHTRRFDDPAQEAAALADGRVDGALVLRDPGDALLPLLAVSDLPLVHFFTKPAHSDEPYVDLDNVAGGALAAEHLQGLGHRRVGMFAPPSNSNAVRERREGFVAASGGPVYSGAVEGLALWFRAERLTGLFCWSDDTAFEAVRALQAAGLRVPEDASVVGFDSSPACERFAPTLSSVRQPVREMAAGAVRLLAARLAGEPVLPLLVPPALDARASSAPPLKAETP